MQPSNTLLAPSRFMSSDIRFVRSFVIVFVAFAALFLTACNQNTPDDTKKGGDDTTSQHQPSDPASWSPVGKTYVCDYGKTTDKDYRYSVVDFFSKDSAVSYVSSEEDLTPKENYGITTRHWAYECSYPNIKFIIGNSWCDMAFKDTLTLYNEASKETYTLR